MPTILQPSLSGGEIAPSLYGRVDTNIYQTSVRTCLNFVTQVYGGAKNRQGSRFIANAYAAGTTSRLIPFTFNANQNYILELTGGTTTAWNGHLRVFSRGRIIKYDADEIARKLAEESLTVTTSDPVTVVVPWLIGDIRDLKFSQSGDVMTVTHPSYPPYQILRYSNTHWGIRLLDHQNGPFQAMNFDKAITVSASSAEGGTILSATYPIFTGTEGMLFKMETADYGQPWEAGVVVAVNDIRRSDGKYYQVVSFEAGATKTGTLRPSHTEGLWSDGGVVWNFLHPGWGTCLITQVLTAYTAKALIPVDTRLPDTCAGSGVLVGNVLPITQVGSSANLNSAGFPKTLVTVSTASFAIGSAVVANLNITYLNDFGKVDIHPRHLTGNAVTTTQVEFDYAFANIVTDNDPLIFPTPNPSSMTVLQGAFVMNGGTYKWAFGAWGGDQGYPTCSSYFQQRHCFAATPAQPQAVWMSKTGDYANFGDSNPIQDDDSLSFSVASAQIDGIESLLTMDRLVMFTLGGNWVTGSGQSEVVTPGNISVKLQNYYGSANLPPLGIGNTVLYYGKGGTIRDMAYDFMSDSYTGNDLTFRSNHLVQDHTIYEWAFQQAPFPIIWSVRDDGVLLGMTYSREEKVIGWHRHTLTGSVESVAVINECGEDHVYLAVKRTINGSTARHIECLYGRVDDELEACFVDAALTYDGRNTSATTITVTGSTGTVALAASAAVFVTGSPSTDIGDQIVLESSDGTIYRITLTAVSSTTAASGTIAAVLPAELLTPNHLITWAFARDAFSGINHLEGQTVSVYAEGAYSTATVSGGAITVTPPAYICTVGLPITADFEPLDIVVPGPQGPLRANRKLVDSVRILVENSRSCYIGPNASNLYEATIKDASDTATAVTHHSGVLEVNVPATWNQDGRFFLRHTKPYPLSILGLLPEIKVGG